jgi:hypothetical protein
MTRPASFSGWSLEAGRRLSVQMNDYPRQNPAYRLTINFEGAHSIAPLYFETLKIVQNRTKSPPNLMFHFNY